MIKCGDMDNVVTYQHVCDTTADMANIPSSQITLGSACIVLDGDSGVEFYMAKSNKQWVPVMLNMADTDTSSGD